MFCNEEKVQKTDILNLFGKLRRLAGKLDDIHGKMMERASALSQDRIGFLANDDVPGGYSTTKQHVATIREQLKCWDGNTVNLDCVRQVSTWNAPILALPERINCVHSCRSSATDSASLLVQGILTFIERVEAMCEQNVMIEDVLPSVATRGKAQSAIKGSDSKQECAPEDALFLLDVQFPGSYLEQVTSCAGHEPVLVSSM